MTEIILAWDDRVMKTNPDLELTKILEDNWLDLEYTIKEIINLMKDAKNKNTVEDRKLRRELIRDIQALHWSKASMKNLNIGIFIHPWKNDRLTH